MRRKLSCTIFTHRQFFLKMELYVTKDLRPIKGYNSSIFNFSLINEKPMTLHIHTHKHIYTYSIVTFTSMSIIKKFIKTSTYKFFKLTYHLLSN